MKCYARFILDSAKLASLNHIPDRALQPKLAPPFVSPNFGLIGVASPYPEVMGNKAQWPQAWSPPRRARHPVHSKVTALLALGQSATPEDSRPGPRVQLMAKVVSGHGLVQALYLTGQCEIVCSVPSRSMALHQPGIRMAASLR